MPASESPSDFWRFVNGIKHSSAVAAVQNFNTREPAGIVFPRVFRAVGQEVGLLVGAARTYHFFTNPDLKELHAIECCQCPEAGEAYSRIDCKYQYNFDAKDPLRWDYVVSSADHGRGKEPLPKELHEHLGAPAWVMLAPFFKGNVPFGYYAFCWYSEAEPPPFRDDAEGRILKEAGIAVLNYVQEIVERLICNHYPVHRDTYIPTFQRVGFQPACVLFADIRNFTTVFESSRLRMEESGDAYSRLLVGFLKAYLEAASVAIVEPGIGRIDKFIGDGIMSTFGEHIVCSDEQRPEFACLLGLYASAILQSAFDRIKIRVFEHKEMKKFMYQHNDVLDMRLGVGINYGKVMFDYFGSSAVSSTPGSNLIGGYTEYTAIGDHVNTAQRLESLANKPIGAVGLLERGPGRAAACHNFTAPIVMSRTVFKRLQYFFMRPADGDYEAAYRSSFTLKGMGSAVEAYEVKTEEINGDRIINSFRQLRNPRLSDSIEKTWDKERSRFGFDDAIVHRLITTYLP